MNPTPIELEIYGRYLCVVPLPGESPAAPPGKSRIELLDMAKDGKLFGEFKGQIIDLRNLPEVSGLPENLPVSVEAAYWLRAVFGQAIYIQSLIPDLAPLASASGNNSQSIQTPPA
jgi:hypothetical protein